jgi:hypothetical protein
MRVNPKTRKIGLVIALLALAGCESKSVKDAMDTNAFAGEQKVAGSELNLQDFMTHVVEHNAKEVWNLQATVMDADGVRNTYPKTDEEWERAESFALTLAEVTRPLDAIGGGAENPDWLKKVTALRTAAQAAAKSAEAKQINGFLAGGDSINEACLSCHYAFAPHLELPQTQK